MLIASSISAICITTPALAQVRQFDVAGQPAAKGIPEFARQADVQILVSERAVRGKSTAPVKGTMTVREAVERLLHNTGLHAISSDGRTFTLTAVPPRARRPPAAPQNEITDSIDEEFPPPDIIVTGFRSSLSKALAEKKRQTAAVDTIMAEDIGKFPDSNLAESMQRLPGISLTRGDGGEGRNITVRGLAAEFTRVRINGMEGASQTGSSDAYGGSNGGRSFDFNVFSSEIFTSIAVRKTPSANIEEGSLGATIDIDGPHPLDYPDDIIVTATARGLYNGLAQRIDPRFSGFISKKFADGTFGILASLSYGRRHTRDVGYSAVLVLPAWVNGGFCSPVGINPTTPDPHDNAQKGTDAFNCSTGNPRTGSIEAWNKIQDRLGPQGQPGGGAFFPRLPRYLDSQQDAARYGGSVSLQWSPNNDTNISIDGLYSRFDVVRADSYISGLSFARSASSNGQPMTSVRDIVINSQGSIIYGLYDGVDVRSERWIDRFSTELRQGTLKFDHRFSDRFKLNGIVGFSRSNFDSPHRMWVNIDANDTNNFSVDFRKNAVFPNIDFGIDVSDPENFDYGSALPDGTVRGTIGDRKLKRTTRNKTLGLDAEWAVSPAFKIIVGGQYRVNDYRSTILNLDPARQATQDLPTGTTLADLSLQITKLDKLLGHGAPASWTAIDHRKWMAAVDYDDSWFCGVECGAGDSRVKETIKSGYGMVTFNTEGLLPVTLRGDAGFRHVHTDQYSFGYIPVAAPAGSPYPTIGEFIETERSYGDWLPSMNLVVELNSNLLLRFGAARVMSRPQLAPLVPSWTIDAVGRRGSITNPELDPIRAGTFDAALEWYFSRGSLASVAYFRKNIRTFAQSINSLIPFNELGLPESLLANSKTRPDELFTINRFANTPGGTLEGVEINAQTPLTFLPGALGNFGLISSLTFVTSKIDYILQSAGGTPTLTSTDDLVDLSRWAVSNTLYYEDSHFSARVTGNYRSGFIRTIPSGAFDSDLIGNDPTFFMDFSASLRVAPKTRILFEVQNLTDETNVQYIDSVRHDSLFALRSGRTFTLGASFAF